MSYRCIISLVLLAVLAPGMSYAGEAPAARNLNPDPNGPPWFVDGYVDPLQKAYIQPDELEALSGRLATQNLPSRVDHSFSSYMRPVFVQDGGSCGSASRICYMFAYELNSHRDVGGNLPENIYPSHFTWLLTYQNSSKDQMAYANGVPNSVDYGGDTYSDIYGHSGQDCTDADYGWMTGYDKWYGATLNRLESNSFLPLDTPENLDVLKDWISDHHGDSDFSEGGVAGAGCAISGVTLMDIPAELYEGGKKIVTAWGPSIDHGTTWSGYDDSVAYDFNDDGQITNDEDINGDLLIDMADWERGALIMLNSWGSGWANSGTVYVPYRLLKINSMEAEFYHVRKAYTPRYVMKVLMDYSHRSEIRISVGIAPDTAAARPERTVACHHFIFAGNGDVAMLGRWADGQVHTEPMEFGFDLTDLSFGFDTRLPYRYFLQVETDAGATGSGTVHSVSVMDYTSDPGGIEIASYQSEVPVSGSGDTAFVAVSMPGDPAATPEYIYIPQSEIAVHYYDSQETVGEDGRAVNTIDGDPGTIWHTRWYGQTDSMPHEIQLDLGAAYDVAALQYLPRQNSPNGRIAEYEIYVSSDGISWGAAAATGTCENTTSEQTITFAPETGRYVRLVALSEVNGNPWTSAAELNVLRSSGIASVGQDPASEDIIRVFRNHPNPFAGTTRIHFRIPSSRKVAVRIYDVSGREVAVLVDKHMPAGAHKVDWCASGSASGVYFCRVTDGHSEQATKLILLR